MKNFRTKEIADLLGVTPQTIRKYVTNDEIPYHKTPTGQLFFTEQDIKTITGDNETIPQTKAYYLRSSSGNKDLIQSQLNQLKENFGEPKYTIKDSASGLNENRQGLKKLIKLAQENKITHIYITTPDRLTRFGYSYLETLFQQNNVQIITLHNNQTNTPEKELLNDFMALIASFSGRFYKLRTKENQQKLLKKAQGELNND